MCHDADSQDPNAITTISINKASYLEAKFEIIKVTTKTRIKNFYFKLSLYVFLKNTIPTLYIHV